MTAVALMSARLAAITAVTSIVSSRIFGLVLPEGGDLPAIRLQQVERATPMQLRGSAGVVAAVVQVDCVATGLAAAEALMAAVRGDFTGGVATGVVGWKGRISGTEVLGILPAGDERPIYDPDELRQVKVTQDFAIPFRSAA